MMPMCSCPVDMVPALNLIWHFTPGKVVNGKKMENHVPARSKYPIHLPHKEKGHMLFYVLDGGAGIDELEAVIAEWKVIPVVHDKPHLGIKKPFSCSPNHVFGNIQTYYLAHGEFFQHGLHNPADPASKLQDPIPLPRSRKGIEDLKKLVSITTSPAG